MGRPTCGDVKPEDLSFGYDGIKPLATTLEREPGEAWHRLESGWSPKGDGVRLLLVPSDSSSFCPLSPRPGVNWPTHEKEKEDQVGVVGGN